MATSIKSTALDFNNIKANLKTYLKQQDEFSDYDFEASGLSNILDVLAYNTHINGLIANMSLNESFLGTAQLRPSVASLATGLGYIPFSRTGSKAIVNISVDLSTTVERPSAVSLPVGTKFTATVDDVTYTFQTQTAFTAIDNGAGIFQFLTADGQTNLEIFEGSQKQKTFRIGESSNTDVYIIPDLNMDTSTALVKIFPNATSVSFTAYSSILNVTSITENSTVYILKEVPNGFYQLSFGSNNILGAQPESGNVVTVDYLASNGPESNRATGFTAANQLTVEGTAYPLFVTTVTRAHGGKEKEEIESIRKAAPFQYATQNRMVTPEDYSAIIKRNFPTLITNVKSWGGEDNPDPKFGTVFSAIIFPDEATETQKTTVKQGITNLVADLAIISFKVEFTDPINTYIENDVFYQINPNLTPLSIQAVTQQIEAAKTTYYTANTGDFDKSFRRSNLLTDIDAVSPAVLSSRMDVRMQQRITPSLNAVNTITLTFPAAIHVPLIDTEQIITSTAFKVKTLGGLEKTVKMKNVGTTIALIDTATKTIIVDSIGSIEYGTGKVKIVSFKPTEIPAGTEIKVSVIPANESVVAPVRNNILQYDASLSNVTPVTVTAKY